jgi:nifR3 family TIM-barrel protein
MISAEGLTRGHSKTLDYLKSDPAEKPLAVQLFGSKPDAMAHAAQIAIDKGADLVDINMGCPVKKVVKTGAGSSLLRDPKKAAKLITATRLACPVPLTVKIRAGWSPDKPVAREIARVIEDCGADAVTVHPRFTSQGFSAPADWRWIAEVKSRLAIPVIGNGDVFKASAALEMKKQTGCDGVMLGRGGVGNPWIFRQILHAQQGLQVPIPSLTERRSLIMEHFHLLSSAVGEYRAARQMRGLLLWYTKGLPYSTRFRDRITRVKDVDSLMKTLDTYFSTLQDRTL